MKAWAGDLASPCGVTVAGQRRTRTGLPLLCLWPHSLRTPKPL